VRDYSEKRGAREARESVDRKPVAKNRPRKEPGGISFLLSVLALLIAFGAGVGTGWFVFRGPRKAAPVPVAQAAKKDEPAPAPAQPQPDAPLTFYKTLAGGKGAIGTGMNLKKPEPGVSVPRESKAGAPAAPPVPEPAAPASVPADPAPPVAAPAAAPASAPAKPDASAHFVVQVASYREKQEALTVQSKLAAKGIAAYLVESKVADKGVWYRLRVGRHLSRGEAGELAGKSGKGAIVVPE